MRPPHYCRLPDPIASVNYSKLLACSQVLQQIYRTMSLPRDLVSVSLYPNNIHLLIRVTALTVYDLILSFPTELRCIWEGRLMFRTGTILYLSIRYGTIIYLLIEMLDSVAAPHNRVVSFYIQLNISWSNLKHRGKSSVGYNSVIKDFTSVCSCKMIYALGMLFKVYTQFAYVSKWFSSSPQ